MFQSIPDNTRNLEWEQVVPSLLGTILGNANYNYIDSVLVSTNREDGTLEEPSLHVILNKLICLVVIDAQSCQRTSSWYVVSKARKP
jgi:hypothetical protein